MMGFLKGRGKKILAVDFSQAMMEIVYVRAWPDRFKLLAYESKKIPSDEEKRAEAIIGAMNEFLSRNSIAGKDVILSLSDMDSVVIKHLVLPNLPEAEILGAARWQMKEDVPFDLEGASIDWQVVSSSVDEEGVKKNAAVFIAAQKEKIAWHLSMMQRCRLNPVKIVSGPFNYAHLLKHIPGKTKAPAILDIDYKCSSLNIYKDNTLHFTRRLPISWEKLTRSLTESLSSEKGNIELTLEEAEEIRNTHGIPLDDNQTITDNIQATHIISLIRPLLEALVRELKFSFHYMASNSDLEKPSLLFITGGGANLKNLDKYLSKELGMEVAYLSLPACVERKALGKAGLSREEENKITNVLGAVMGGPQGINLLPYEMATTNTKLIQRISFGLVFYFLIAFLLFWSFTFQFQAHDYKNRLKNARMHLKTMGQFAVLEKSIGLKEDFMRKIQTGRVPVDGMLRTISALVPGEIILSEMVFDQANNLVALKGTVAASEDIAETVLTDFMRKLEASPFFSEVNFISSRRVGSVREFELRCDLSR